MLNLDTHILIYLLNGDLGARERQLVAEERLAISDICCGKLPNSFNCAVSASI